MSREEAAVVALRTRLTAAFVLVVLVPLLIGAVLVTRAVTTAAQGRETEGLQSTVRTAAAVVVDYCARARAVAELAARQAASVPEAAGAQAAVRDVVSRGLVEGARLEGPAGELRAQDGQLPPPEQTTDCTGDPAPGTSAGAVTAVVRTAAASGEPAGQAVAGFSAASVRERLSQGVGGGTVALVADGRVVDASGPVPPELLLAASNRPEQVVRVAGLSASLVPARRGQSLGVLVARQQADTSSVALPLLAVVLGSLLLAAVIGRVLARATTRPLEELGTAAARVASGDLDTSIPVRSRDEIGRLATSFNEMTDDLRTYVGELQASRDELQRGLTRIGRTLSGTHDLDQILTVVLETAMTATRARAGMVLLLSPGRDELVLKVGRGLEERAVPDDLRVRLGAGVSGRVAQRGEAVQGQVGEGPAELRPAAGEPWARHVMAVPLTSSSTVIGVLDLYDRSDGQPFDEADLTTMRTFANQATVAVDNVLLHEEAQRLSITDGLTGLWNIRYFSMTANKEIERAARFGRQLSVLLLDLDHFKQVNDTHGHQRGDAVLVELAARCREALRDVDTVARYGGEEFVVLLPETDLAGAGQAAERLCQIVRARPFGEPAEAPVALSVSIGGAVFPGHGTTAKVLLRKADEALYAAKHAGRDRYVLAPERAEEPAGPPAADRVAQRRTASPATATGQPGAAPAGPQPDEAFPR